MIDELFKGYIQTKNKKSLEKFKDRNNFKSYEEVEKLSEFAGVLQKDVILIDIDDKTQSEILLNIVEQEELICRVYQTSRGMHFLFKNDNVTSCKTHCKLAIGLVADIKVGCRNSIEVLKFNGEERKILYDKFESEQYQIVPSWLTPVKSDADFLNMNEGDGRNQALFTYIITLQKQGFTVDECKKTISIINEYIFKSKLSTDEINTICRKDAFLPINKSDFFKGNLFLFNEFSVHFQRKYHIIKINNQLHLYHEGVYVADTNVLEHYMIKEIPQLNRAKRSEVIAYLNSLIITNTDVSDAKYISFANGVYDCELKSLLEDSNEIILTNKIKHNYNPNAYSAIVDNTLNKLSCNDIEVRQLLEEIIGSCFYRRNELRKAFILVGDKANGKSTFIDMLNNVLGSENTVSLDLKEIGDRFKTAELFEKLVCTGDDISDEFICNPATFKKVVSGERLNAERKGQDPFDFNNYAKFIFSANTIPRIKDKTGAVADRLVIVPFNATFSKSDKDFDPYIKYKLKSEESIEYLIKLGIEGLQRMLNNQAYTIPTCVCKQVDEYNKMNNPILLFFDEIKNEEIKIENSSTNDIYRMYCEFCIRDNLSPLSQNEFTKAIKKQYNVEVVQRKILGKNVRIYIKP